MAQTLFEFLTRRSVVITIVVLLFVVLPSLVMFGVSFGKLQAVEVGLNYNNNIKYVANKIYRSGLYFLGIGHWFLKFPKTLVTIDFTDDACLNAMTSDGLPTTLEISFQYQLDIDKVYDLYMSFGMQYEEVYWVNARTIIFMVSTNFSAYNFFNDQTTIANVMLQELDNLFSSQLNSNVVQLQLRSVVLPPDFEQAIENTIIAEQAISKAQYEFQTAQVDAATQVISAMYQANITVTNSIALANQTVTLAYAEADANSKLIDIEALSLSYVMVALNMNISDELTAYMWYEAVGLQDNSELFVGMNPSPVLQVEN